MIISARSFLLRAFPNITLRRAATGLNKFSNTFGLQYTFTVGIPQGYTQAVILCRGTESVLSGSDVKVTRVAVDTDGVLSLRLTATLNPFQLQTLNRAAELYKLSDVRPFVIQRNGSLWLQVTEVSYKMSMPIFVKRLSALMRTLIVLLNQNTL